LAIYILNKALFAWPVEPDDMFWVLEINFAAFDFFTLNRERQAPGFVVANSTNEILSD